MNASQPIPASPNPQGKQRAWQLDADQQELEHLRDLLREQTEQLKTLQATHAPQQSLDIVQRLITLYEQALRQAEEQATFHQKTLDV